MDGDKPKDVVFVDAYNLMYRAYHGNNADLRNSEGLPTNAIYTISTMLMGLRKKFDDIAYALAVFDGGGNFRTDLDADYKANRKPMPDDLKAQAPYVKEVFEILGWPIYQAEGVEADDVIGTLALRAAKKGFNSYVVSGDKDFRQIVGENLHIVDTMNDILYTPEKVMEKMGVGPENVRAYLALVGDSSDNVAGVEKCGPKTAAKWLAEYGDLDGLIAAKDSISGKIGEYLRSAISSGQLAKSYDLVTLRTDLDVSLTAKQLKLRDRDETKWTEFCGRMGFRSLSARSAP